MELAIDVDLMDLVCVEIPRHVLVLATPATNQPVNVEPTMHVLVIATPAITQPVNVEATTHVLEIHQFVILFLELVKVFIHMLFSVNTIFLVNASNWTIYMKPFELR